jgi:hypothetical protein
VHESYRYKPMAVMGPAGTLAGKLPAPFIIMQSVLMALRTIKILCYPTSISDRCHRFSYRHRWSLRRQWPYEVLCRRYCSH